MKTGKKRNQGATNFFLDFFEQVLTRCVCLICLSKHLSMDIRIFPLINHRFAPSPPSALVLPFERYDCAPQVKAFGACLAALQPARLAELVHWRGFNFCFHLSGRHVYNELGELVWCRVVS